MITKEQFCKAGRAFENFKIENDRMMDEMDKIFHSSAFSGFYSEMLNGSYSLITNLIAILSSNNESFMDDLEWFVYETDFGKGSDDSCTIIINNTEIFIIHSWEAFYDYLLATNS